MTLFHAPSVQSPRAYDQSTLAGGNSLTRTSLRGRLQDVGSYRLVRTPGEITLGVADTAINYGFEPGSAERFTVNAIPGTTVMDAAIQNAIDAATQQFPAVYISQESTLSKPLLIRNVPLAPAPATTQNLSIVGNGRTSSLLSPNAASISAAPQNINCLIFNQNANGHLHLKSMRCWNGNAYTGIFVYATQGGGADATGHSLFSCSFDDLWLSFGGSAAGIFRGGFQNMKVTRCDFESTKNACFLLEGAGNADQHYSNNIMFSCFDAFIDGNTDTLLKAIITVDGLHAYNHQRGPLISITKGVEMQFRRIVLEPGVGNAGTTGLFQFTDCTDVICDGFIAGVANTPNPKCAIGVNIINGFTGKFSNGKIVGTVGFQLSGVGALDLTIDNVDFTGCDTAFKQLSGTISGDIYIRNCKLNNNQLYGLISQSGAASWNLTMVDCEIMNCGLNGVATNRNMDITTSGNVNLIRCKIGQNNAGAAAANFIRANGAGAFNVIDPILVGAAPTALLDGTNAQVVTFDGVDSTMVGMPQFVPAVGGSATYSVQQGRWSLKNRRVTFEGRLTITAIGTGSATTISGLPFTSNATTYGGGVCPFFAGLNSALVSLGFTVGPATTSLLLRGLTAAAAATVNPNSLTSGTDLMFFGSYSI